MLNHAKNSTAGHHQLAIVKENHKWSKIEWNLVMELCAAVKGFHRYGGSQISHNEGNQIAFLKLTDDLTQTRICPRWDPNLGRRDMTSQTAIFERRRIIKGQYTSIKVSTRLNITMICNLLVSFHNCSKNDLTPCYNLREFDILTLYFRIYLTMCILIECSWWLTSSSKWSFRCFNCSCC